jgi:transcriptional regulator with PAS, ATPase and Fis domain
MSPALQAKFLRVLEDGHYRRVGGTQEKHADVRVVAATNKALEEEVKAGRFREDLFFRLNVIAVTLPPLKDRREDIVELVEHFLRTRQVGKTPFSVDSEAMRVLHGYDWPGNVRELANVLERAQILAEGVTITTDDLPENLVQASKPTEAVGGDSPGAWLGPDSLEGHERRHVASVLQRHGGNKVHAAKALGVSRRTLYRLIDKYGLAGDAGSSSSARAGEPGP